MKISTATTEAEDLSTLSINERESIAQVIDLPNVNFKEIYQTSLLEQYSEELENLKLQFPDKEILSDYEIVSIRMGQTRRAAVETAKLLSKGNNKPVLFNFSGRLFCINEVLTPEDRNTSLGCDIPKVITSPILATIKTPPSKISNYANTLDGDMMSITDEGRDPTTLRWVNGIIPASELYLNHYRTKGLHSSLPVDPSTKAYLLTPKTVILLLQLNSLDCHLTTTGDLVMGNSLVSLASARDLDLVSAGFKNPNEDNLGIETARIELLTEIGIISTEILVGESGAVINGEGWEVIEPLLEEAKKLQAKPLSLRFSHLHPLSGILYFEEGLKGYLPTLSNGDHTTIRSISEKLPFPCEIAAIIPEGLCFHAQYLCGECISPCFLISTDPKVD